MLRMLLRCDAGASIEVHSPLGAPSSRGRDGEASDGEWTIDRVAGRKKPKAGGRQRIGFEADEVRRGGVIIQEAGAESPAGFEAMLAVVLEDVAQRRLGLARRREDVLVVAIAEHFAD